MHSEIEEALAVLEDAKGKLAQVAERVQNECEHHTVVEKKTQSGTYFSAIGPTIICLNCRKEWQPGAYNDWSNHAGGKSYRCPSNVKLILTEQQAEVPTVYSLRLP